MVHNHLSTEVTERRPACPLNRGSACGPPSHRTMTRLEHLSGWLQRVSKTPLPSQVPAPDPQLLLRDEAWEPQVSGPSHQRMCPEVTSGSLCLYATHSGCSGGPTACRARAEVRPRSFTFRLKPLSSHMNLVSFCHFVSCDTVLHADTLPPTSLPLPLCSTSYSKKHKKAKKTWPQ